MILSGGNARTICLRRRHRSESSLLRAKIKGFFSRVHDVRRERSLSQVAQLGAESVVVLWKLTARTRNEG
eukprot:11950214-Prorocentrum_lima.AAC.1